jgi:hypothetical protein
VAGDEDGVADEVGGGAGAGAEAEGVGGSQQPSDSLASRREAAAGAAVLQALQSWMMHVQRLAARLVPGVCG